MTEHEDWFSPSESEEAVWWGQPRPWRIWPAVGKSLFWAALFLAVAVVGPRFAPTGVPGLAVTGVGAVLALASLRGGVLAYLRTANTDYVLTTENIYEKHGVWSTTVTRVGLVNVQNTRLNKDFWGARFGYGTVAISTAGSGGTDVSFTDLRDPESCREQLKQLLRDARTRSQGTAGKAASLDSAVVDQVREDAESLRNAAERLETEVTAR
jgi:membrane protein YdbS with pleckstrin-like domain